MSQSTAAAQVPSPPYRQAAVQALGAVAAKGDGVAVAALVKAAGQDEEKFVRLLGRDPKHKLPQGLGKRRLSVLRKKSTTKDRILVDFKSDLGNGGGVLIRLMQSSHGLQT
eukprot:3861743-Amphidinium_carterae.1